MLDGLERRVGKRVNGVMAEAFLYDGPFVIAWLDGNGAVLARFVRAAGEATPEYMEKGGSLYRLVTDHLGSVRLVVEAATGAVAQQIDYDEFGRVLSDSAPGFQPFAFAGGLLDRDTGLTRFGARDYDAETGRWISKDPLLFDGGSTNLYAYEYVANDPLNLVDPMGLYAKCAVKGNKVTITIPIQFQGPGASKRVVDRMRQAIPKEWSRQNFTVRVTRGRGNIVNVPGVRRMRSRTSRRGWGTGEAESPTREPARMATRSSPTREPT